MTSRFSHGAKAYTKDGRAYTVEMVEDGMVYCSLPNGTETEFPEASLLNQEEWTARSDGRRDVSYSRIRQAYPMPAVKLDRAAAAGLLAQAERLVPGLLDFVAFTTATRIMAENKSHDLLSGLSIVKCRQIFDEATPEVRVTLLATLLGVRPDMLIKAAGLGENMARAMLDKGLSAHAAAFESFGDRPRR
ncbi:MAG: hypothetical protein EPO08_12975 [Rhodospirillaceae bacterium]|nr:MAG: hypothetical protein EPO08_12975 [Rhodospirillaceae bacterium]